MKFVGHRGARHEAPENTLAGIDHALAAGVDAIEIDVHLAASGEVVVIHDFTLERTTDGEGPVVAKTLAELKQLDACGGERIPTLSEVLERVRGRCELFVEIKALAIEEAVVDVIRGANQVGECFVKAFDHRVAQRVKQLEPALRTCCLLVGRPVDPVGIVRAAGGDVLSLGISFLDADLIAACHADQVEVCAWNCNDPAEVQGYRAMGLDWLCTDRPAELRGH